MKALSLSIQVMAKLQSFFKRLNSKVMYKEFVTQRKVYQKEYSHVGYESPITNHSKVKV